MTKPKADLETCREAVAEFWRRTAKNDTDLLLDHFEPDAVSHDPVGEPPITTVEAHRALFDEVGGMFKEITFETENVYESAPKIGVRWHATGTLQDGTVSKFGGLDVFEISPAGKIAIHWGFWNPDGVE